MIEVKSVGDMPAHSLSRHTLAEVIKPRFEEIFKMIRKEGMFRMGWDTMKALWTMK